MSPTERALWTRLHRRASTLQPELARAVLRAFVALREALTEAQLAALIQSGALESLLDELFSEANLASALEPLKDRLRWGINDAARLARRDIGALPPVGTATIAFDILNPSIRTAIAALETRVMQRLAADVREAVRQHVAAALEAGVGPRAIARGIRDVVGLAPNQEAAVRNFRAALEAGDRAKALGYVLRDRRFDAAVKKGALSPAQIDRMVDAYRRRMVAFHAETVSRTAALNAQKLGQRLAWEDAVGKGAVDAASLRRTWIGVMDDRERDTHVLMEGVTVGFDEPFRLPDGLVEMEPGDQEYNCRCLARVWAAPAGAA